MPELGENAPTRRQRLVDLIERWTELDDWIKALTPEDEEAFADALQRRKEQRRELRDRIDRMVFNHPKLYDFAIKQGFPEALLPEMDRDDIQHGEGNDGENTTGGSGGDGGSGAGGGGGSGGGGGGGGGGDNDVDLREQAQDNRLLGDYGKHYDLVKGPKGSYVIRYRFKIKGEVVDIGMRVGAGKLARYGLKPAQAKSLSAAKMRKIKNIGYADQLTKHFRKGDNNVFRSLIRELGNQYEGSPMLEDDEVMSVVIAKSLFGWSLGEFENQLRNTKWWNETNDYQRDWVTRVSPKQKAQTVKEYTQKVVTVLEDYYGLDWMKHVDGGMKQAREWAEKIASGGMGTSPDKGLEWWSGKHFRKAAEILGTPAHIQRESEEEERRARLNRPEDMYETLRAQADQWLGERYRPDRGTLMRWAEDLVSEKKSDSDWMTFLRQQTKAFHPWKNDDTPWADVASSYMNIAQDIIRKPLDYRDKLFSNLGNEDGKAPLSAYEFELMVRNDDRSWQEGTRLWDEGTATGMQLANLLGGVQF